MRKRRSEAGYALASVLFLVVVLSVLSVIVLRSQLMRREAALRTADDVRAMYAAGNGVVAALEALSAIAETDTTFALTFRDGSAAEVAVFGWGLYAAVESEGCANHRKESRCALIGGQLSDQDNPAFVLGNLQHGLTFSGVSHISGEVVVGPRGVAKGSLRDELEPVNIPITGNVIKVSSSTASQRVGPILNTALIDSVILRTRSILHSRRRGPRSAQDYSERILEAIGYLDLTDLSDSVCEVFGTGNLSLAGTIMRRGPPLRIVAGGHLSLLPGLCLNGLVAIYSTDSIVIPSQVKITNCLLASEKSITVQSSNPITAQLFAPVIRCTAKSRADYPSLCFSANLSDSSRVAQSIELESGSQITGAVIMHVGVGVSMQKAVIDLEPGSVITGEIYTDGYLTMDGTVNGLARTYDLYFYSPPTIYLGWLRKGLIDRKGLPYGFLRPLGISNYDRRAVLTWL